MSEKEVEDKPECVQIPEHVKPLVDCCAKFEKGEINAQEFFSETLIQTGKFMKVVSNKQAVQVPVEDETG